MKNDVYDESHDDLHSYNNDQLTFCNSPSVCRNSSLNGIIRQMNLRRGITKNCQNSDS